MFAPLGPPAQALSLCGGASSLTAAGGGGGGGEGGPMSETSVTLHDTVCSSVSCVSSIYKRMRSIWLKLVNYGGEITKDAPVHIKSFSLLKVQCEI